LLGRFVQKALGDVRKWREVNFTKADAKIQGGHAFKTMAAYEKWLAQGGEDGMRQLAVLRLLGLFDRPADAGCLTALRREPAIPGLTESLIGLGEDDWNLALSSLADCRLISVHSEESAIPNLQSEIRNGRAPHRRRGRFSPRRAAGLHPSRPSLPRVVAVSGGQPRRRAG
jgi:hypothetical protein